MRSVRGARDRDDLPGSDDRAEPVYTVGWQIAEQLRAHEHMSARGARRARSSSWRRSASRTEPPRRRVPAPVLGRDAAARDDRDGARLQPALLIADEPTTALDVTIQAQILELLKRLQREHGSSIILITHDLGVVADIAERVVRHVRGQGRRGRRPRAAVFRDPQHPYTWGLLGSMPRIDRPRVRAAGRDPGCAAVAARSRRGLPVRAALSAPVRALRDTARAPERVAPGRRDACHLDPAVRPALRRASLAGDAVRESA